MTHERENPALERRAVESNSRSQSNAPSDFVQAMRDVGLESRQEIIADGRIHRFQIVGDKNRKPNGWYILHTADVQAGAFGNWKTGQKYVWSEKRSQPMSPEQRAEYRQRLCAARQAQDEEQKQRHETARVRAGVLWDKAMPAADTHPYLVKKGVRSHGLRLSRGALVIPMRDAAGVLHSLQFINADGSKRFLSGGRKKACYFAIGKPADRICIAEGYATAASIYEATGIATAVAFDAGNMVEVAKALRAKFPALTIIICADNDTQTVGNPGLSKATAAAQAVGGLLAVAGGEVSNG